MTKLTVASRNFAKAPNNTNNAAAETRLSTSEYSGFRRMANSNQKPSSFQKLRFIAVFHRRLFLSIHQHSLFRYVKAISHMGVT
jgi:predicted glycosyltransferase involved in capsule biosynthesis